MLHIFKDYNLVVFVLTKVSVKLFFLSDRICCSFKYSSKYKYPTIPAINLIWLYKLFNIRVS